MSITSIQPGNTICYMEKPPKPLGPVQEERNINRSAEDGLKQAAKADDGAITNKVDAPKPTVNANGQIIGSTVNTVA